MKSAVATSVSDPCAHSSLPVPLLDNFAFHTQLYGVTLCCSPAPASSHPGVFRGSVYPFLSSVDLLRLATVCFLQRFPFVTRGCWELPCWLSWAQNQGVFNSPMCPTQIPDSYNWQRSVKASGGRFEVPVLLFTIKAHRTLIVWELKKKKTCILLLCKDQWNLCIPPSVCVYMCLCVCVSWSGSVMLTICNRSSLFRSQSEIKIHPHVAKVSSTHHGNRSLPANECPLRPKQMLAWPLTPNTFVTVGWPLSLPSPLGWSTICHSEGDFIIPDKTSRQSVVGKCHC